MKNKTENILAGMDIGNGYLKGTAVVSGGRDSIDIDYQSVASLAIDPVSFSGLIRITGLTWKKR